MAEDGGEEEGKLPRVDHGPLNEGPWEKYTDTNTASDKRYKNCI